MSKVLVAPSILSGDFARLGESVKCLDEWNADYVHVDVMDGDFVPNITIGMPVVKAIRKYSKLPFDVHLMIKNPEKYVSKFVDAGADIVTFHPNATENVEETLNIIKSKGAKCGLAINPDIPLSFVVPYLDKIDMVVIMGVYAGFGGQKYIPSVDEKIAELRKIIDSNNYDVHIEVDGGVTTDNAKYIAMCGADILVAGTAVFGAKCPNLAVKAIQNCKE